jgi:hypothetical protein
MAHETPEGVPLPLVYDFSHNSKNPYVVELRHNLIPRCLHCNKFVNVKLDGSDYFRFFVVGKDHAQDVFPYLTADERELLISGIHPECFAAFIGPEDDPDAETSGWFDPDEEDEPDVDDDGEVIVLAMETDSESRFDS